MASSITKTNQIRFADSSCLYFTANHQYSFIVYDTNCEKRPNVYGKDIWNIFELNNDFIRERDFAKCKFGCQRAQVLNIC